MHILLTDVTSCPRCGPEYGLILLADRIEERRVLEGTLGCANCRGKFAVRDGVADLRLETAPVDASESRQAASHPDDAVRLAALMGVTEGPGFLLLAGPAAAAAPLIAALIDAIEVIAAQPRPSAHEEQHGVSRVLVDSKLPFYSHKLRGVVLSGSAADVLLEEAARVLGPGARLVLESVPADAEARLAAAGMRVLARQGDTIVSVRA